MIKRNYRIILFLLFLPLYVGAKTINPLDYGLREAKTGEERFWVLYRTHELAHQKHLKVSYKGIEQIALDIPEDAKSIPLSDKTDFCNCRLVVTNTERKNFYLFVLSQQLQPIDVTKDKIDNGDFRTHPALCDGHKLLVIVDENPWVDNRTGYDYGVKRKDILYLRHGCSVNKTISPYNNSYSQPKCSYVSVSNKQKLFQNISFIRTGHSSEKTFLLKVYNQNNVRIDGIQIITPEPITLTGDIAILLENCVNATLTNIRIDGTYSSHSKFGYGIALDNVWNSYISNIESNAAWGVFGNHNVNTVHMNNSSVNRFDAHCYARDFTFTDCEFSLVGLNQSSFMGDLIFEHCVFNHASVCESRYDYNAYTSFTISIKNCTILLDEYHHSVVKLSEVPQNRNTRYELKEKYAPNINISRSKIVLDDAMSFFSLYLLGSNQNKKPIDHWGSVSVDSIVVEGKEQKMMVVNRMIETNDNVNINIKGIEFTDFTLNMSELDDNEMKNKSRVIMNLKTQR